MTSIRPLVESEPPGWIWSINKIQDFRNHQRNENHFYIIHFFRKPKKLCSDIDINNMLGNNDMVSKIFYSIDRSNLTKWFRLNQWSNRAHITAPASQKPKFCNYEKQFEIAWDMYDFWGPKAKSAPDLKNEKSWKVLGRTKYVRYRCNNLQSVHWMKIEAFINNQMSNSGKLNLFPPLPYQKYWLITYEGSKGLKSSGHSNNNWALLRIKNGPSTSSIWIEWPCVSKKGRPNNLAHLAYTVVQDGPAWYK